MNHGQVFFRDEPATSENAVYGKKVTKSTGGCCCGDAQKTNITRDKTMNETLKTTNKTTTVTAPEIVCGGCASSIKKALGNVRGVSEVEVDVATKKVTVKHGENVSQEKIVDALDRAGYSVAS